MKQLQQHYQIYRTISKQTFVPLQEQQTTLPKGASYHTFQNNSHIYYKINYNNTTAFNPKIMLSQFYNVYFQGDNRFQKISKNIYLKNGKYKYNKYLPLYLITSQLLCFNQIENQLMVDHLQNKSYNQNWVEKINSYLNHWEIFFQVFSTNNKQIQYNIVVGIKKNQSNIYMELVKNFFIHYTKNILKKMPNYYQFTYSQTLQQNIRDDHTFYTLQNQNIQNEELTIKNNRLLQLTPQQRSIVFEMKTVFPDATNNQLCRFLKAKQFDLALAIVAYKKYLQWKESMKKYDMEYFEQIIVKNIYRYIGNDRQGRPVVLSIISNFNTHEINHQKYLLFYIYFFQIFLPTKMQQNADQILVIADCLNLKYTNFNISLFNQNSEDAFAYAPERQYKAIGINVSWFGLNLWKIVKKLMPTRTAQKIIILGEDRQKIIQVLSKQMDMQVIPKFLGGRNEIEKN